MVLGGGSNFKITATGGLTVGNAGSEKVKTTGNIRVRNSEDTVNASALGQTGNAGAIRLEANKVRFVTPDAQTPYKAALNAKAGTTNGTGGRIEVLGAAQVTQVTATGGINVNAIMKVDGGSSLLNTDEGDYGRITLNGVTCQRRTTNVSDFLVYANCVTTGTSSDLDKAPASVANSALATRSGTDTRIHLHVFNTRADYQSYFSHSSTLPGAGETWEASGTTPNIYTSVWEKSPSDGVISSEATLKEVTIHEGRHAFEILLDSPVNQKIRASTRHMYSETSWF
ncbi:MAG: hypothetical protein K8F91_12710 [Candidatus Obscuribacterales bacterium]|nr:hypothetical protein [Candidatus Obscuribacterales bacterium]